MSIRTNTNGRPIAIPATLQDVLRRNGMQAQILENGGLFSLAVQGHDSPVMSYPLNAKQLSILTDYGTNHANKQAYNTFVELVSRDFDVPRNFVHARNANGRVAMGLHGYRIGVGEYGRMPHDGYHSFYNRGWCAMDRGGFHHPFLGWTPRQQMGYHMRRIGDEAYFSGAPMTPVRPDGRIKPGEQTAGGYGFYYKGSPQQATQADPLNELKSVLPAVQVIERHPKNDALPYKEAITSNVYFTDEKWQEVLRSHGIVIDADKKTLTLQSSEAPADLTYDLRPEELKALTANDLKTASLDKRLDIINKVIGVDFAESITKDMLNSKQSLSINLKPEALADMKQQLGIIEPQMQQVQEQAELQLQQQYRQQSEAQHANRAEILPPLEEGASIDGGNLQAEAGQKGWYREGRHGREVEVGEIRVEPVKDEAKQGEAKYRMTAVINGEAITHEITSKQYDKFLALDDEHRMKLFAKVFPEVDIKRIPREERMPEQGGEPRIPFGQKLMMALSLGAEATHMLRGVAHDVGHIRRDLSGQSPELYLDRHGEYPHGRGGVYFKAGVDTYQEVAARAFEAGMTSEHIHNELHHGM